MYDLIIIGSGPAGLSAAIYAQRAVLNTLVIEKNVMSGGQILNTYEVDNYPGYKGINGFDLGMKLREHADELGAKFVEADVTSIQVEGVIKKVITNQGTYETKAIIIATGARYRKLDVPGEAQYAGMGVSYCATCDGAFFRNKTTCVVGGGDVAVEDAIFLARMCEKVYVIHRRDEFRAAKSLQDKLFSLDNVEIIWDSTVKQINGEDGKVSAIEIKNVKTQEETTISCDGVFIAVGIIPNSDEFKDLVAMDEQRYLVAEEDCVTNIEGIFAAGDIRTKMLRQIITAASDGANAVTSVQNYLNSVK
ncbi:thioredoxin-disulfide reductase [Candidatus Galacturonibacter soehngenii]|uniref:Thioredoxin reductase n=1 Tax=Candidatus Galacturonatibacter soehngenii TaxID=2307010 RepID=A0A7V7QI03_9FIRM|nr:thioredoxin-disulfide reductase [Candidatus Galacturonibacter soehngenii]KAB1434532.1 thioredoxin-disulfide reductase [Candidatus Galacturonibacter soehngenii]MBA4688162.1 thioredoxin-disulfide reductase [Candidatus Galacturonibacter soehngenii]